MIETIIFDMDGLLIDSEGIWQEEERKLFGELGLRIDEDMQRETYGLGTQELIEYWYHKSPWENYNPERVKNELFDRVEEQIFLKAQAKEGAHYIIDFFKQRDFRLALASSSPMGIIEAGLEKLNLKNTFERCHSATEEEYSKPHPAVYIRTALQLNVNPLRCLVFEDSIVGTLAAKAARMKVVSIPGNGEFENPAYGIADLKISSLNDFTQDQLEYLIHL